METIVELWQIKLWKNFRS